MDPDMAAREHRRADSEQADGDRDR